MYSAWPSASKVIFGPPHAWPWRSTHRCFCTHMNKHNYTNTQTPSERENRERSQEISLKRRQKECKSQIRGRAQWNTVSWTCQGCCTFELMEIVAGCTRPASDWANQHASIDGGGVREAPPQLRSYRQLTASSWVIGRVIFLEGCNL